eukprot:GHVP01005593.1.p1 GENE.GHVP01005593.1~~GHVP01005593.1.p1  ORF type:complete len:787 (+),score=187.09 GHVP01005593.1:558-2918(+)
MRVLKHHLELAAASENSVDRSVYSLSRTSSAASSLLDRGQTILADGLGKLQKYLSMEVCSADFRYLEENLEIFNSKENENLILENRSLSFNEFYKMVAVGELKNINLLLRTKLDLASVIAGSMSGDPMTSFFDVMEKAGDLLALPECPNEEELVSETQKWKAPDIAVEVTVLRKDIEEVQNKKDDFEDTTDKCLGKILIDNGLEFEKETSRMYVQEIEDEEFKKVAQDNKNLAYQDQKVDHFETVDSDSRSEMEPLEFSVLDTKLSQTFPATIGPSECDNLMTPTPTEEAFLSLTSHWLDKPNKENVNVPYEPTSPFKPFYSSGRKIEIEPPFFPSPNGTPPLENSFNSSSIKISPDPRSPTVPIPIERNSARIPAQSSVISMRPVLYPTVAYSTVTLARRIIQEAQDLSHRCATTASYRSTFGFLAPADVLEMCEAVLPLLAAEDSLVQLRTPAKVFGALHGDLKNLLTFFELYGWPDPSQGDICSFNYVFLGNYVDLGKCSCEVVILLLAFKVLSPGRVFLLRGNHEDRRINAASGFRSEVLRKFGSPGAQNPKYSPHSIWNCFNDVFEYFPIAAILDKDVICVHGAVGGKIQSVSDLSRIKKPIKIHPVPLEFQKGLPCDEAQENNIPSEQNQSKLSLTQQQLMECLWANPSLDESVTTPNQVSCKDMVAFAERNKLRLLVRGHQCVLKGFYHYNEKIVNVFTAADLQEIHGNDGAILTLTKGRRSCDGKNKRQLIVDAKVVKYSTVFESLLEDPCETTPPREDTQISDMSAAEFISAISMSK